MILRTLGTLLFAALLLIDLALPCSPFGRRGPDDRVHATDAPATLPIGATLPPLELVGLGGERIRADAWRGERVLLVFERSLDWSPASKIRLLGLRDALADEADLLVVWVMSDRQLDARARGFIAELGLADDVLFLGDPRSRLIQELGILDQDMTSMREGAPHPTTLLLDRQGRIRFVDFRDDSHRWLDPRVIERAIAQVE